MNAPPSGPPAPAAQWPWLGIRIITDRNATTTELTMSNFRGGNAQWVVTGSAKRAPGDRYDPETGEGLALGRALEKLGQQVRQEALARVTAAEHAKHDEKLRRMRKVLAGTRTALTDEEIRGSWGEEAAARHRARANRLLSRLTGPGEAGPE